MQNKRLIAIDPGFDRMGVAILERVGGQPILLFSTCIKTRSKDAHGKRIFDIGDNLEKIINDWKPEDLAIETLFFNQNTTSALGVAEARGVAIFQCASRNINIYEYSPQAIKIAVTGYGKADKIQVGRMVQKLVKIPQDKIKKLDDELDAIAVGITHVASERGI